MNGWFKIYSTRNYAEANIIKGMLEENNIEVIIMNKLDSSYINFGDIELYVPNHLKDIAKICSISHRRIKRMIKYNYEPGLRIIIKLPLRRTLLPSFLY